MPEHTQSYLIVYKGHVGEVAASQTFAVPSYYGPAENLSFGTGFGRRRCRASDWIQFVPFTSGS